LKRAILISASHSKNEDVERNLLELEELARSVGIFSVAKFWQFLDKPLSTYVGKGKLEKIANYVKLYEADGIIADDELSVVQKTKLEEFLKIEVLDRTEIILKNFARSARTSEGKAEVELAMLEYRLSHLKGSRSHLSRTGGGIGTRGPGESKLETDRRAIRERIRNLKKKISKLSKNRDVKKRKRNESLIPKISIAGYTNAGKSMLLKQLSRFDTKSEDKLFTTLDPTTKKVWLGENVFALVSDTVGFISKLPTQLVNAFHSTLEEVLDSELIIVMIDGSDEAVEKKLEVSKSVLKDIGAEDISQLLVVNKIDLCDKSRLKKLSLEYPDAIFISAKKKLYLEDLTKKMRELATRNYVEKHFEFSNEKWFKISKMAGIRILNVEHKGEDVKVKLKVHPAILEKIMEESDALST
jgi:GTP-binding protein HflX